MNRCEQDSVNRCEQDSVNGVRCVCGVVSACACVRVFVRARVHGFVLWPVANLLTRDHALETGMCLCTCVCVRVMRVRARDFVVLCLC